MSGGEELFFGIEITRRCNLACPHCFTSSGGDAHPGPDAAMLEQLLSDLAAAGVRSIAFSGGEPLLRKDLPALLRRGRSVGILHQSLVTNGFAVNKATARELVEAGLDSVQISVDGVDAADHCAVRDCEPRDYYRALRAVRVFLDLGIVVDVAAILSERNARRAPEMAMLCEALGVRGLRYCTFVPTGRGATAEMARAYRVRPQTLDRCLAFIRDINLQPDARLRIVVNHAIGPWLTDRAFRCRAGRSVAYMSAEGDLYPCPCLLFEPFAVGNVLTTPVRELLASPAMSTVRLLPKERLEGMCRSCANKTCSGGCRGAVFARTGDIHDGVSYCNYRRLLRHAGQRSIPGT